MNKPHVEFQSDIELSLAHAKFLNKHGNLLRVIATLGRCADVFLSEFPPGIDPESDKIYEGLLKNLEKKNGASAEQLAAARQVFEILKGANRDWLAARSGVKAAQHVRAMKADCASSQNP